MAADLVGPRGAELVAVAVGAELPGAAAGVVGFWVSLVWEVKLILALALIVMIQWHGWHQARVPGGDSKRTQDHGAQVEIVNLGDLKVEGFSTLCKRFGLRQDGLREHLEIRVRHELTRRQTVAEGGNT